MANQLSMSDVQALVEADPKLKRVFNGSQAEEVLELLNEFVAQGNQADDVLEDIKSVLKKGIVDLAALHEMYAPEDDDEEDDEEHNEVADDSVPELTKDEVKQQLSPKTQWMLPYMEKRVPGVFILAVKKHIANKPDAELVLKSAVSAARDEAILSEMLTSPESTLMAIQESIRRAAAAQAATTTRKPAPDEPVDEENLDVIDHETDHDTSDKKVKKPGRKFSMPEIDKKKLGLIAGGAVALVAIVALLIGVVGPMMSSSSGSGNSAGAPPAQPTAVIRTNPPPAPVGVQTMPTTGVYSSPVGDIKPEHVLGAIGFIVFMVLGLANGYRNGSWMFAIFLVLHFGFKAVDVAVATTVGWNQNIVMQIIHVVMPLIPFLFLLATTRPGVGVHPTTWDGFPLGLGLAFVFLEIYLTRYIPGISEAFGQLPAVTPLLGNMALLKSVILGAIPPRELFSTIACLAFAIMSAGLMYLEARLERDESSRPLNVDLVVFGMIAIVLLCAYTGAQKIALWLIIILIAAVVIVAERYSKQLTQRGRASTDAERASWLRIAGMDIPEEEVGISLVVALALMVMTGSTGGMWPPAPF